jgi:hypothetical protein
MTENEIDFDELQFQTPSRFPFVMILLVFLGAAVARLLEASRTPYSYPTGASEPFYKSMLVGGALWVLFCGVFLLAGVLKSRLNSRPKPHDLWDTDLDEGW